MDVKFFPLVELTEPLDNFNLVSSEGLWGLASFPGRLICKMESLKKMEDERTSVLSRRAVQQDRWERECRVRKGRQCDTAVLLAVCMQE